MTSDTRITSITGNLDFPNLSDVNLFEIKTTKVTFIPDFTLVTKQFPKFNKLIINFSGLRHVERRHLASMPQLTYLDLYGNQIESLPEDVFNDMVNLEILLVSSNKIKLLPPKLLWNMPKLKEFKANRNQIELIPRDFFKNNRELEKLLIDENKIRRIEVDLSLVLPKLKYLNLEKNTCVSEICSACKTENLREIQQKIDRNCTGRA
jgi:Leucine-rich repeat (LRR) protein